MLLMRGKTGSGRRFEYIRLGTQTCSNRHEVKLQAGDEINKVTRSDGFETIFGEKSSCEAVSDNFNYQFFVNIIHITIQISKLEQQH